MARAAIGLIVVGVPVQLYVESRWGEPYPALFMPSFAGAPQADGRTIVLYPVVSVIDADGGRRAVRAESVMGSLGVNRLSVFKAMFYDDPARAQDERTKTWLRARLERTLPQVDAHIVEIDWERRHYRLPNTAIVKRQIVRTVRIELA